MDTVDYQNLEQQFLKEERIEFEKPVILEFSKVDRPVLVYSRFKVDMFTRIEKFVCLFRGQARIVGVVEVRRNSSCIEVYTEVVR